MISVLARRFLVGVALLSLAVPPPAPAQPTAADPMAPRQPLPPPTGVRPFAVPPAVESREIGLEEALRIALDNAPAITARYGEYLAAQQRVNQALSGMLPQISTLASFIRVDGVSRTFAGGGSSASDPGASTGSGRLSTSQLLWDFGKTWAATDAARAQAEVSREQVEFQKDDIVLRVKESYFNLLFAARLVVVQAQAVDRGELNLKSARGFFEVGTRPKSDVTRAEVEAANARVDLIRAQNAVSLARIALNTAMGITISAPTRVRDVLGYQPFPLDRATLVGEALARRAEYRQARLRVEAGEARVRQAYRDFFPGLFGVGSVGGSHSWIDSGGSGSLGGSSSTREAWDWQLGIELRWSIFDGGNKLARYREEKANLEAAQALVRDTELGIWQQVEQAHVSVAEAEERIGAAQKAVESAQESFRLNQGRFDAGVGSILELTTAQLDLTRAQNTEAQALADYWIAIARLERALGRR